MFPAGEVSQLNLKERSITDPEWNHHVARLIRITGATVLPVYLLGGNSAWFHLLGLPASASAYRAASARIFQ